MPSPIAKSEAATMEPKKSGKLGTVSGVYIPVCLNILSILMFLRFGVILGQVGFIGILGLLLVAYSIDFLTLFSLSAIASNGEVKGGGPYYLISRSLGPEFGGSIGILFFIAQVLNAALNVVGLIDCIRLNLGPAFPEGYWIGYFFQTVALAICTLIVSLGSATFSRASRGLVAILIVAVVSIPVSAVFKTPFHDHELGIHFTGISLETLTDNFLPHTQSSKYAGLETFRDLFAILFSATAGILAGASMSGDLKEPSKSIPKGTLWATLTTFIVYFVVVLSMASSTTHASLVANPNVIPLTNLSQPIIFGGECAVTAFSTLMGIKSAAGMFRALAKDKLLPGFSFFDKGMGRRDVPILSLLLTYAIAQVALLADLNQIATLISMGFQMTFFVMNLACFFLKIGAAPNFRPSFKFFSWQTAFLGSWSTAAAMFFIDSTYASLAICVLVALFLLIHYLCPPKRWGDVSQNLIYHQVRKYLLRLKPEHIKFWRPHIILLINNPRKQTRLIQFCNSMKKGSLYILGHVIVTNDFNTGVAEAKLQQHAWTNYISESANIKAFVQLTMSPSLNWGIRNLILSAGLGGMRPNIAVLGFYNMDDLRKSNPRFPVPEIPTSIAAQMQKGPKSAEKRPMHRRRGDTSARLLEGKLPTDVIRTEGMMNPTEYMTILEDLALRYRLNTAVGYGFERLETPRRDGRNTKRYIDLWPIQMSAEITSDGKSVLTTNFDTYTLILQLGHILESVKAWRTAYELRVMVFVEYESEVAEETARVKALLEKLRIEATVKVFWLASGQLNTYELIINGHSNDIDWEIIVNEALRDDEWWDDLQVFRGRFDAMSSSQERTQLAHILDSTSRRPGVYNHHEESLHDRRRHSMADFSLNKPTMSKLSKLGVRIGMHTLHLNDGVMQKCDSDSDSSRDDESSDEESDIMHRYSRRFSDSADPSSRPLLSGTGSRRRSWSHSKGTSRNHTPRPSRSHSKGTSRASTPGPGRSCMSYASSFTGPIPYYGTMSPSHPLTDDEHQGGSDTEPETVGRPKLVEHISAPPKMVHFGDEEPEWSDPFPAIGPLGVTDLEPGLRRSRSMTSVGEPGTKSPHHDGTVTPSRPCLSRSRQSSRFSSRPVPEPVVTGEGDESQISFSAAPSRSHTPGPERLSRAPSRSHTPGPEHLSAAPSRSHTPGLERPEATRHASHAGARFSSRPVPETKVTGGDEDHRTITFADEPTFHSPSHSRQSSRHHSRQSSHHGGDINISIPELLESYRLDSRAASHAGDDAGSTYSTQSFALSFNDLPSRAQHLILNELIRRHSRDTAVLLSTLPIPSEGTSSDEIATVRYLSDVEVLCNELPPTLMVLSNNMTVTVSL